MRRRHAPTGSILLIVTLMISMAAPAAAAGRDSLAGLCHTDPTTGNVEYLEVREPEASVHLEHGDLTAPNGPGDCVASRQPGTEEPIPTEEPPREESRPTEAPPGVEDAPAPVAQDDEYTVAMGVPLVVPAPGVLANDGGANSAVLVREPSWGTLDLGRDGSFTYVADRNHPGTDVFAYQSIYDEGYIDIGEVHIYLPAGWNSAPVCVEDAFSFTGPAPYVVPAPGVLANDHDPDGHPLTATSIGFGGKAPSPSIWGPQFNADGGFTFIPESGKATYELGVHITDGWGEFAYCKLFISVEADPASPVAAADVYTVPVSGTLVIDAASGVLANDSSPVGSGLTVSMYPYQHPSDGTLTLNPDGSFTYAAPATAPILQVQRFWYQVTDSQGRAVLQRLDLILP